MTQCCAPASYLVLLSKCVRGELGTPMKTNHPMASRQLPVRRAAASGSGKWRHLTGGAFVNVAAVCDELVAGNKPYCEIA